MAGQSSLLSVFCTLIIVTNVSAIGFGSLNWFFGSAGQDAVPSGSVPNNLFCMVMIINLR